MVGGGGASCRKRVRAAAGRGAFAGSATRGGAGARRRTTSGLRGRTPAAVAARGVGAAAVARWGTGAHFSKWFLSTPGQSPAELNAALATVAGPGGLRLDALTLVQPNAVVARMTGRDAQALVVSLVTDHTGRIDFGALRPAARSPQATLPAPTGRAAVGRDVVQVFDRARRGRRLVLTRWYPAMSGARHRPRAAYTGPLRAALGLAPLARVHARIGARARRGRLPVVLFSPGSGTARDIYQSLAEDLASHGYLVVAVDHTGETPLQFPDGHVEGRSVPLRHLIRTEAAIRLADMRLVLRRLNTLAPGPRADLGRVAAVGHSLGGSTAAALMRAEPRVRARGGPDSPIFRPAPRRRVDPGGRAGGARRGSFLGPARRRAVAPPFMVLVGGRRLDGSLGGLLKPPRGPRPPLGTAGSAPFSFSALPVPAPASIG